MVRTSFYEQHNVTNKLYSYITYKQKKTSFPYRLTPLFSLNSYGIKHVLNGPLGYMSTFRDKKPPTRTFLELCHAFHKKVVREEGAKDVIAVQCIIAKPLETLEEHKEGKKE